MRREDKFGYGFLAGSIGVPLLILAFFDSKVTAAGFGGGLLAIAVILLYLGHADKDERRTTPGRGVMGTICLYALLGAGVGAFAGACAGLAIVLTKKPASLPEAVSSQSRPSNPNPLSEDTGQKLLRSIEDLNKARKTTSAEPLRPYQIKRNMMFRSSGRDKGCMTWAVYASPPSGILVPANLAVQVQLINKRPVPTFLDRISMEAQDGAGKWRKLILIDTAAAKIYFGDRTNVYPMTDAPGFSELLYRKKPLQPEEIFIGWILAEYPPSYVPTTDGRGKVRIRFTDITERFVTSDLREKGDRLDERGGITIDTTQPHYDFSSMPLKYYSDLAHIPVT